MSKDTLKYNSNKGQDYLDTLAQLSTTLDSSLIYNKLCSKDNDLIHSNIFSEFNRSVDLSYCSQSHRFFIRIDLFKNGEGKIKSQSIQKKPLKKLLTESFRMPIRCGEIYQSGMTNKAKGKIKLASRILQHQVLNRKEGKPYASFITLTYGLHYPDDHLSKKHLDNFIKRLKRKHPKFQFIWVIEKQKRGAPHFHILTPEYIDKDLINKSWNGVVSKWQKANINEGVKQQQVYPNIGKVFEAGKYMTKYMQKEGQNIGGNMYGIDYTTRNLMKAETITIESSYPLNDITNHLATHLKSKDAVVFDCKDFNSNSQYWLSQVNEFHLNEFLHYTVPELELKIHQ